MRLAAYQALLPAVTEKVSGSADSVAEQLVQQCLATLDQAVIADDYTSADHLLKLAGNAAQKSRSVGLVARVQESARELAELRKDYASYRQALADLDRDPADAQAMLVVGRMWCFIHNDWARGLPLLAEGADAALSELAKRDLSAMSSGPICDPPVQMALANAWWDLAQTQPRLARGRIEGRAGYWYRRALPQLSGLSRAIATSRLSSAEPDPALLAKLRPGLVTEIYAGTTLQHRLLTRIDAQINCDWGNDAPGEGLPRDDFSVRWSGWIKVPRSGKYTFVVQANSGARLQIDGKTLLDQDLIYRSRNGIKVSADLTEGIHAIQVEFWDTTGIARMILSWIPPGAKEPQVVPADAFGHEPTPELQAELARQQK